MGEEVVFLYQLRPAELDCCDSISLLDNLPRGQERHELTHLLTSKLHL